MTAVVRHTDLSSLVQVDDQCAAVEAWAEQCDSVPELRDAGNKLAAIDEYLTRTSTEGRSRVAAAMRRLEVRIADLSGNRTHGGDRSGDQVPREELDPIPSNRLTEFRQMARHRDVVEDVIAASTDEQPASRRRVQEAIKNAQRNTHVNDSENPGSIDKSRAAVRERERRLCEMAAEGHASGQIGAALGITAERVKKVAKRLGVEIPADRHVGRAHFIDANRVMEETVLGLDAQAASLSLMDGRWHDLDPDRIKEWVTSLTSSLRLLNRFCKQLKEMTP